MNAGRLLVVLLLAALAGCASDPGRETDPKKSAQVNAELGLRYMMQGNHQLALEKLERSLGFDDEYAPAHHYLGELYSRLERSEKAGEHFRMAVRYAPDDPRVHNSYGIFLCKQKRYDAAEEQFLEVLEDPVYPRRAQTLENIGLCLLDAKPQRAERYFRKALAADPKLPKTLRSMAELSLEQENPLSARAYLQRYSEVAPHTAETLWLGVQAERALGDRGAAASYGLLLKRRFPESAQAERYQRLEKESR